MKYSYRETESQIEGELWNLAIIFYKKPKGGACRKKKKKRKRKKEQPKEQSLTTSKRENKTIKENYKSSKNRKNWESKFKGHTVGQKYKRNGISKN